MEIRVQSCIMLTIIGIAGSLGNFLVCIVYLMKRNTTTTCLFILTLSTNDLICDFVLIPLNIYMEWYEFTTNSILLCRSYHFFNTTIVPASCLLMTTIAVDRHFKIFYPHRQLITKYRAKILVASIFTISCLMGIIPVLAVDIKLNIMTNQTICSFEFFLVSQETVFAFRYFYNSIYIFSAITITIVYSIIYAKIFKKRREKIAQYKRYTRALNSKRNNLNLQIQSNLTGGTLSNTNDSIPFISSAIIKEFRTVCMLFMVSYLFILTYLPAILMTYEVIKTNLIIFFLYFTSTVLNPLIYCFMNINFRNDLKCILFRMCCKRS
jgi:hypothetical protein